MATKKRVCDVCEVEVLVSVYPSVAAQTWAKHLDSRRHRKAATAQACLKLVSSSAPDSHSLETLDDFLFNPLLDHSDDDPFVLDKLESLVAELKNGKEIEDSDSDNDDKVDSDLGFYLDSEESYSGDEASLEDRYIPMLRSRAREQELTFEERLLVRWL